MRPYLVLTAVVLMTVAAFGQQPFPHPGPCAYGCGPFVPLLTTPQISLQTVSPNPVGATNATAGLVAGATNSTLSETEGATSASYTVPVWYQGGGAPVIAPDVHLWPGTIGHEDHPMHEAVREEHARTETRGSWTYFSAHDHTANLTEAAGGKGSRQAGHVYTNDDITRQNDKNGDVKHGGKSEKL